MTKFKVGDRVKVLDTGFINEAREGDIVTITEIIGGKICNINNWGNKYSYKDSWYELINESKKTMNITNTIKLARMNEPEKTLVKAELMNLDGSLTESGKEALNDLLVQKFKEELKTTYATPILEAKE